MVTEPPEPTVAVVSAVPSAGVAVMTLPVMLPVAEVTVTVRYDLAVLTSPSRFSTFPSRVDTVVDSVLIALKTQRKGV